MSEDKKVENNEQQIPGEYLYIAPHTRRKGGWWKAKTTREKVFFIIAMVLLALSIAFLLCLAFIRDLLGDPIGDLILGVGIPNGFVAIGNAFVNSLFNIVLSLITIVICFVSAFVINVLIKLITSGSKRGMTTGSLIRSLVKYAAVIIAIGVILTIWGANVIGVVASMGVLTLVIGLGCQSLISDIISGLFIVFDDYFSVGDMVIIDGFRGYVEEIGLRTVKLNDNCGNVKAITNSSISSCVNLSRHPNYIAITMDGSYFEDVERLEAVFARELPKIKETLPQIIDGPWYKGIDNFNNCGVGYMFACTCRAEHRFQVARDFKREIYQMFVRNDIIVPFQQLVINSPDPKDRPHADDEQRKESKKLLQNNREVKKKQKEKFSTKIKKATKSTVKEFEDSLK